MLVGLGDIDRRGNEEDIMWAFSVDSKYELEQKESWPNNEELMGLI